MEAERTDQYEIEEETTTPAPELNFCVFRAGEKVFSVPVENLLEIAEQGEIVPLPGAPEYLFGISHYRGMAIPVVDITSLSGNEDSAGPGKWLLVLRTGDDYIGFSVNEMPDLSTTQEGEMLDLRGFFERYRIR